MFIDQLLFKIKRKIEKIIYPEIAENVFKTDYNKNCLILYIIRPFQKENLISAHQNIWQVKEIAKIISDQEYNVDVIDYNNYSVSLHKNYDLIFDICPLDTAVYQKNIRKETIRIAYLTGANATFANKAELERIQDLEKRRGIRLQPRRQAPYSSKILEEFNGVIGIANKLNMQTYLDEFNLKNVFLVPNSSYDFGTKFDTDSLINSGQRQSKNFLYFGSSGSVHKGLDRLLEIFAEPNFPCVLYVCGSFKNELDFQQAYYKELYETSNIISLGFIDINGPIFETIAQKCVYTILPSCSEGMSGTINTAISAGIIPICSRECGFNEDDVIILKDCEMGTIRETVLEYSRKPKDWIIQESKKVLEISNTKYSREAFSQAMSQAIAAIIEKCI